MAHFYPPFVGNLLACGATGLPEEMQAAFCDTTLKRGILNGRTVLLLMIAIPVIAALFYCVIQVLSVCLNCSLRITKRVHAFTLLQPFNAKFTVNSSGKYGEL